ncbi:MAG: hypothetical protein K6G00_06760 [Treponema sp.]|nr:hypothetical protein [Treponema sp.]
MLFAQESVKKGVISGFEFSGLKRTRESYLLKVLQKYKGTAFDEETSAAIENELREQGLFSSIDVQGAPSDGNDGDTTVKITLKEKISFLVLPFGSVSNGGLMGGAAMLDQNAFGEKDTFLLGGMIAKNSFTVLSSFRKPAIDIFHPGFSVSGTYSKQKTNIDSLEKDTLMEIDGHRVFAEAAITGKFSTHFSGSAGINYTGNYFIDKDLDNIHIIAFHPVLRYEVSDWNGVFTSSKSFEVSANIGCTTDGDFVTTQRIHAFIQQPVIPTLRFLLEACMSNEHNMPVINQQTRSSVSNNLLPSNFHSPKMLGSNFGLEFAAIQTKFAMLSIYGVYQIVLVKDYDDTTDFSYGPGGGVRIYLSTINLPAVGMGLYYNIPHDAFEFGVSMGVSF